MGPLDFLVSAAGTIWSFLRPLLILALILAIPALIIYGIYSFAKFIVDDPNEAGERICLNLDNLIDGFSNTTLAEAIQDCNTDIVNQCEALLNASYLIQDKCSSEFCDAYNLAIQCFCRRCGCFKECEMDLKEEVCPAVCAGGGSISTTDPPSDPPI